MLRVDSRHMHNTKAFKPEAAAIALFSLANESLEAEGSRRFLSGPLPDAELRGSRVNEIGGVSIRFSQRARPGWIMVALDVESEASPAELVASLPIPSGIECEITSAEVSASSPRVVSAYFFVRSTKAD